MGIKGAVARLARNATRRGPAVHWQALWFAIIGGSGTIITFAILTFLHKGLGWGIALSNIPAYSAGILNNYTWNRLWTYRHVENGNVLQQGLAFAVISVCGLVINTTVLAGTEHAGVPYLLAFAIATVVTFGWNFTANHNLTFRHKAAEQLHHIEEVAHHLPLPARRAQMQEAPHEAVPAPVETESTTHLSGD
jgi:putative flippase GtrA